MTNCPACAGPPEARAGCATCNGVMEVTQEVYETFIANKEKQKRYQEFVLEVEDRMNEGIDQTMSLTIDDQTFEYTP